MSDAQITQVSVGLVLREMDGPSVALKKVMLGQGPLILITPSAEDDAGELKLHFDIDATGFSNQESLADTLDTIASALRDGEPA